MQRILVVAVIAVTCGFACSESGDDPSGADAGATSGGLGGATSEGKTGTSACGTSSNPPVCGMDGAWQGALTGNVTTGGPKCQNALMGYDVSDTRWTLCGDATGLDLGHGIIAGQLNKTDCKARFEAAGSGNRKWSYTFANSGNDLAVTVTASGNFCGSRINGVCSVVNCVFAWTGTLKKCPASGCTDSGSSGGGSSSGASSSGSSGGDGSCAVEPAGAKPGDVVWSRVISPTTGGGVVMMPHDGNAAGEVLVGGRFDGKNLFVGNTSVFEGGKAFMRLDGTCGISWLQSVVGQGLPRVWFNSIGGVDLFGHHEAVFPKTTDPGIEKGWSWLIRWDADRKRKWRADPFETDIWIDTRLKANGDVIAVAAGKQTQVRKITAAGKVEALYDFQSGAGKPPWQAVPIWSVRDDGRLVGMAQVHDTHPWTFDGKTFKAGKGAGYDTFFVGTDASGKRTWSLALTSKDPANGGVGALTATRTWLTGSVMKGTKLSGGGKDISVEGGWIARLDTDGKLLWHKSGLPVWIGVVLPVADDGVVICGHVAGTQDLAGRAASKFDRFIARLDKEGKVAWSRTLAGKFIEDPGCVLAGNTVVIGGGFTGSLKLGSKTWKSPKTKQSTVHHGARRFRHRRDVGHCLGRVRGRRHDQTRRPHAPRHLDDRCRRRREGDAVRRGL